MPVVPHQSIATLPRSAVLAHLRGKIDRLEGTQYRCTKAVPLCDLIDRSLPYKGLPLGCIHEVKGSSLANAITFASLLSARTSQEGAVVYIAPDHSLCPLGLLSRGIQLERWIHVCARRPNDLAWTVLEALRCPQVKSVLAVMHAADLTFCRRLQLAAESSGATGFLINNAMSSVASAITRWRVSPAKEFSKRSFSEALWELELLYCRGGRPGKWSVVNRHGSLEILEGHSEASARPVRRIAPASKAALAG